MGRRSEADRTETQGESETQVGTEVSLGRNETQGESKWVRGAEV